MHSKKTTPSHSQSHHLTATSSHHRPLGIMGLVEYKHIIRHSGAMIITKVPVRFEDIVFFSREDYVNNNGEPEPLLPNYVWFQCVDGEYYFIFKSLTELTRILPDYFVRINNKYIVNVLSPKFWGRVNGSAIKMDDRFLKLTDTYREAFNRAIEKYFIE